MFYTSHKTHVLPTHNFGCLLSKIFVSLELDLKLHLRMKCYREKLILNVKSYSFQTDIILTVHFLQKESSMEVIKGRLSGLFVQNRTQHYRESRLFDRKLLTFS